MKLSLTMTTKNELDNLKRLKPLVEPFVDEWIVVFPPKDPAISWAKKNGIKAIVKDFTLEVDDEVRQGFAKYDLAIDKDYRVFKFAEARNEALQAATGDYVLWLDADDVPINLEALRAIVEAKNADQYDLTYDYARDNEGNSIADQVRERVIRNNGRWEWKGAKLGVIHETIAPKDGFIPYIVTIDKSDAYIKHISDHHNESSERNFIALLFEYIKTKGEDARTTYYLGTEFFNHKMYEACINVMQEYIRVGGWDEERYRAWLRTAEAYQQLDDQQSARNAYLSAIKELPKYPDAYLGLGESYYATGEWDKAIEFTLTGMQKPIPETKSAIDKVRYTFRPVGWLAIAYLQQGNQEEAWKWFHRAKTMNPNHPWVREYTPMFEEAKDLNDYVKSFVKLGQISNRLYPKTMSRLAEAIPDELMEQEVLMDFKWRYTRPKIWENNSVVFFCSEAFEEWGPDSLKKGTGGSEEAIIQLAPRLAKLGFSVTVYNNCPREGTYEGVKWVRYERFNPRDIFNVLISWRNNVFLRDVVANKKLIDMHDVPEGKFYTKDAIMGATLLMKSGYHRSLVADVPDEQIQIIPNGIVLDKFQDAKKVKNNLVWTSSYDRGLKDLLEMWEDVKEEVPDATLDVYYGWDLYDTTPWGKNQAGQAWKNSVNALMDQDGITHHGRVGSDEIAEAYKKADVWAYPTAFPEIDCITATKAMAAGAIPVTTDYAVLKERNQGIMVEGDIQDQSVKEEFKRKLIALLKDENKKGELRAKMNVRKYDWDTIAQRWAELLK